MHLIHKTGTLSVLAFITALSLLPDRAFAQGCGMETQDQELANLVTSFNLIDNVGNNFNTIANQDLDAAEGDIAAAEGDLAVPTIALQDLTKATTALGAAIKLINNPEVNEQLNSAESDIAKVAIALKQTSFLQAATSNLNVATSLLGQVAVLQRKGVAGPTVNIAELENEIAGAENAIANNANNAAINSLTAAVKQIAAVIAQENAPVNGLLNKATSHINAAIADIEND